MIAIFARIAFLLLATYVFVVIVVYFNQRSLQYFPARVSPGKPEDNNVPEMREVFVETEDGLRLLAWFAPPQNKNGKIVVYYHGNAGHIGYRAGKARHFIEAGYGILLLEYRGFARNPGRPSEEGFYKDGRAALHWLEAEGYSPAQYVLYGESIGSGVAVEMARAIQPRHLILEAPFTSAADVAKQAYFFLPVDLLMKDRYDNIDKIKDITSSLLIVHGDEDEVIPYAQGQKLYETANHPKEFVSINGGHHANLYEHHAGHVIVEWLDKQVAMEKAMEEGTAP
jgi:fermentation-respiration switch protein FrsA (DUF1100 family)